MRIEISSNHAREGAINSLAECDIKDKLVFTLKKEQLTRSSKQLKFYWMLLTDIQNTTINEHAGTTKEEWDLFFKRTFLMPLFERDNDEWIATMQALRNLWKANGKEECETIFKAILSRTHFKDAGVKQGSEYLTSIITWCHERGIRHRLPDDKIMGM